MTSIAAQAWLLALLADLPASLAAACVILFAALGGGLLALWRRMPPWLDMTFAMVTVGGFGMVLGWWFDVAGAAGGLACHHGALHTPVGHLTSWMTGGMLLLGCPAMFLARHTRVEFQWRRWCCGGVLLVGVPAMLVGMICGQVLAQQLSLVGFRGVFAEYLFMMFGMCAGMWVPHVLEFAVQRHAKPSEVTGAGQLVRPATASD